MSKEKQMIEEICAIMSNEGYAACEDTPLVPESSDICEYLDCRSCKQARLLINAGYRKLPENLGEFSDGYHTFNELYHHRAVLFSVICNMFPDRAWKSKLHDTGDMYDGMFIVGIETEQGQATYHYDIDPYWDIFKVKELEYAPKYDGHTPSDAIARMGNLPCEGYRKQSEWISVEERLPKEVEHIIVCDEDGTVGEAIFLKASRRFEWVDNEEIAFATHWMPLPEAPKGGAE